MKLFFRQVRALFYKEIALEWRSRERLMTMFFFVIVALGVFGLSLQLTPELQREIFPGVLWATLSFAGTLGMGQLYAAELQEGGLEALKMAPVPREAIFIAKQLALFLFLLTCALWAVPLASLMFQVAWKALFPKVILIFLLGLWGFALIGTLMSTLLLQARSAAALLPLLFLPIALPLLIIGAKATTELISSHTLSHTAFWLRLMLIFDFVLLLIGLWVFPSQIDN